MEQIYRVFFAVIILSFSKEAFSIADGIIEQKFGGKINAVESTDTHTYISQGGTLVTIHWAEDGLAEITDIYSLPYGEAQTIEINDDLLFLISRSSDSTSEIRIFSLENPSRPLEKSTSINSDLGLFGLTQQLLIDNDILYAVNLELEMSVFDIRNPDVIQKVYSLNLSSIVSEFSPEQIIGINNFDFDNLIFIARDESSKNLIFRIDLKNPKTPSYVSHYISGNSYGDYVIDKTNIHFFDLSLHESIDWSDKYKPVRIARSLASPIIGIDGEIINGDLYAWYDSTITVYNISDPSDFTWVTSYELTSSFEGGIKLGSKGTSENHILTLSRHGQLLSLEIYDTDNISLEQILDLPPGDRVLELSQTENGLLSVDQSGLRSFSNNLDSAGRFYKNDDNRHVYSGMDVHEDLIALGVWSSSSVVMRMNDLSSIEEIGTLGGSYADNIVINKDEAFVIENSPFSKIHQYQFTSSDELLSISREEFSFTNARDIQLKGNYAYIADRVNGVLLYKKNGNHIQFVNSVLDCQPYDLDLQNNLLAAACTYQGVYLFDISIPENPKLVSQWQDPNDSKRGRSVKISNDLLWFGHYQGVELFNIGNPNNLIHLAQYQVWPISSKLPNEATIFNSNNRFARITDSSSDHAWLAADNLGAIKLSGPSVINASYTGVWQDMNRPGEGLAINILNGGRALVTWMSYNSRGQQLWMQGIGLIDDYQINIDEVYLPIGARFNESLPTDSVNLRVVGNARLVFYDCSGGTMEVQIGETVYTSNIQPLANTMQIGCNPTEASVDTTNANQTGIWADGTVNAQGFSVTWLDNGNALVNWFTNDSRSNQIWIQGIGELIDGRIVFPEMYTTSASRIGLFYDPNSLRLIPWGELILELECMTGTAHFESSIPGFGSGFQTLDRISIPEGLSCN